MKHFCRVYLLRVEFLVPRFCTYSAFLLHAVQWCQTNAWEVQNLRDKPWQVGRAQKWKQRTIMARDQVGLISQVMDGQRRVLRDDCHNQDYILMDNSGSYVKEDLKGTSS